MGITTAMCGSAKAEMASGAHSFLATVTPTGNITNGSRAITSVSSVAGILKGGAIANANLPAGTIVKSIDSGTQITVSDAATGSASGGTLTISYDSFSVALIKTSPAGTYNASSTSYANITGNSDETSGTNYTAGGVALINVSPANVAGTAFWSFGSNPSWTNATLSASGCMIFNKAVNLGFTANRAMSVHDFGGNHQVTVGTFTIILPANDQNNAVLRIT